MAAAQWSQRTASCWGQCHREFLRVGGFFLLKVPPLQSKWRHSGPKATQRVVYCSAWVDLQSKGTLCWTSISSKHGFLGGIKCCKADLGLRWSMKEKSTPVSVGPIYSEYLVYAQKCCKVNNLVSFWNSFLGQSKGCGLHVSDSVETTNAVNVNREKTFWDIKPQRDGNNRVLA